MTYPTTKLSFLLTLLFLAPALLLNAQREVPAPTDELVNDYAGMLSQQEDRQLTSKLAQYARETSTQIVIFTENSLQGEDPFTRSLNIYDKWGIGGNREKSNGVLIYVAKAENKIRIMTGKGAEGFLPDILAKRIIDQIIVPNFRQQRYYRGLNNATSAIMELGQGEYTNDLKGQGQAGKKRDAKGGIPAILILVILVAIILLVARSRRGRDDEDDGGFYRGGRYDMDPHSRRRRGGGWMIFPFPWFGGGGWSSGGGGSDWGGFDGGDFGDFGGFGGGITGGGGAGGEW